MSDDGLGDLDPVLAAQIREWRYERDPYAGPDGSARAQAHVAVLLELDALDAASYEVDRFRTFLRAHLQAHQLIPGGAE